MAPRTFYKASPFLWTTLPNLFQNAINFKTGLLTFRKDRSTETAKFIRQCKYNLLQNKNFPSTNEKVFAGMVKSVSHTTTTHVSGCICHETRAPNTHHPRNEFLVRWNQCTKQHTTQLAGRTYKTTPQFKVTERLLPRFTCPCRMARG